MKDKTIKYYIIISVISVFAILLFGENLSFLYKYYYGYDSELFIYIGRAAKHGYIPYKDIFDIKGPMVYFMQTVGQIICEGKSGMLTIEIVNFIAIQLISYKIAKLVMPSGGAMYAVIAVISILNWGFSIYVGNTVEEYSMLYSMIAVYLTVSNIISEKIRNNKKYYFFLGICAMAACLFRVIDSVTAGACIIYVIIECILDKDYKSCMNCILYGILGCIIIILPFIIYYAYNDALPDMISGSLTASYKYARLNKELYSDSIKRKLNTIIAIYFAFFPLVQSVLCIARKKRGISLLVTVMTVLLAVLYSVTGVTYTHYVVLILGCTFLSTVMTVAEIKEIDKKRLAGFMMAGFIVVNVPTLALTCIRCSDLLTDMIYYADKASDNSGRFADEIKNIIDYDRDKVYMFRSEVEIMRLAGLYSNSPYIHQWEPQFRLNKEIADSVYKDFVDSNSTWLIKSDSEIKEDDQSYEFYKRFCDHIDSNYDMVYNGYGYILYKIKA